MALASTMPRLAPTTWKSDFWALPSHRPEPHCFNFAGWTEGSRHITLSPNGKIVVVQERWECLSNAAFLSFRLRAKWLWSHAARRTSHGVIGWLLLTATFVRLEVSAQSACLPCPAPSGLPAPRDRSSPSC